MSKTVSIFLGLALLYVAFTFKAHAATACGTGTYCPSSDYTCNTTSTKCCGAGTPACGSVCCASGNCSGNVCYEPFELCYDVNQGQVKCKVGQCVVNDQNVTVCNGLAKVDNSNPGTTPVAPTNGVCGSDNGKTLPSTPTNLCNPGTPSAVLGAGNPWTWTCFGTNSGTDASCSATLDPNTAGQCGSSNGGTFSSAPTTNLCAKGTPTGPQPVNTTWVWRCLGATTNADCSATRIIGPVCNNNVCESGEVCDFSAGGTSIACPSRTQLPAGQYCNAADQCHSTTTVNPGPTPQPQQYTVNALPIGLKFGNISDLLTFVVKLIVSLVGVGFMLMLLFGAFKYITSQGDKAAVQSAQGVLTSAIIGLALTAGLFALMTLLQNVFGISLTNIVI